MYEDKSFMRGLYRYRANSQCLCVSLRHLKSLFTSEHLLLNFFGHFGSSIEAYDVTLNDSFFSILRNDLFRGQRLQYILPEPLFETTDVILIESSHRPRKEREWGLRPHKATEVD